MSDSANIFTSFGIDWKLFLAQLVNFAILIFILTKFAYKPLMDLLEKRKKDIEKGVKFTEEAEEKLKQSEGEKQAILKQAKGEAFNVMASTEKEAMARKEEIARQATKKSEDILADAKRAIEEEKAKMNEIVYQNAGALIGAGIEKVLKAMPAKERDEKLIKDAVEELKQVKSL